MHTCTRQEFFKKLIVLIFALRKGLIITNNMKHAVSHEILINHCHDSLQVQVV